MGSRQVFTSSIARTIACAIVVPVAQPEHDADAIEKLQDSPVLLKSNF